MKKIGLIGATGKLGEILLSKLNCLDTYQTVPIVRNTTKLQQKKRFLEKNVLELTADDIKDYDYLICAYGPPAEQPNELISVTTHLIYILKNNQKTTLIICGGVGPLYLNQEKTLQVAASSDVPPAFIKLAQAEATAFSLIEKEQSFNWLYFAPPFELSQKHPINHDYVLSNDILRFSDNGTSILSYEDFAQAIIDTIYQINVPNHKIISVSEQ